MLVVHAGTVRSTRNILNDTASQEKVLKHREGWIGKNVMEASLLLSFLAVKTALYLGLSLTH